MQRSGTRTCGVISKVPKLIFISDRGLTVIDKLHDIKLPPEIRGRSNAINTATNVEIELPVPADASTPHVRASMGFSAYSPERDALLWKIKSFPGGKEYILRAEFSLSSITAEEATPENRAPIHVKFEIPYFTVSGIQVEVLGGKGKPSMIVDKDEGLDKFDATKLRKLRPAFNDTGSVTAGNASTISDGVAAMVLVSGEEALELGLQVIAKIVGYVDAL